MYRYFTDDIMLWRAGDQVEFLNTETLTWESSFINDIDYDLNVIMEALYAFECTESRAVEIIEMYSV